MPYTAYTGKQGEGLATTFGRSQSVDAYARLQQQQAQKKDKQKDEAKSRMEEYAPEETWHFYSAELQQEYDNLVNEGAELMGNKGIPNPWTANDKEAIDWQIKMSKLKASSANISQYQEEYNKAMQAIAVRGDEYTDRYKESIRNFPKANSIDAIMQGDVAMPQPEFKNPSKIFSNFLVKSEDRLQEKFEDQYVSDKDIATETAQYFASPENESDLIAAQQLYNELTPEEKDKMEAIAERHGMDSPVVAYQFQNLRNRLNPPSVNLFDQAMEIAGKLPLAERSSTIEDTEGVTTRSSRVNYADPEAPKQAARSYFAANAWELHDEPTMNQLGIPMDIPVAKRRIMAENKFAQMIKDAEPEERTYGKTREGGSGFAREELDTAFDLWREDLGSNNIETANEAAGYLFATGGLSGFGDVVNSQVIKGQGKEFLKLRGLSNEELEELQPVENVINGEGVLNVRFGSGSAMQRAKERFYKEMQSQLEESTGDYSFDGTEETTNEGLKEANKKLLEAYKKASRGNNLYVPITPSSEQVLKRLHDQAAKETKNLYQRIGNKYIDNDDPYDLGINDSSGTQQEADPFNILGDEGGQ